MVGCLMEASCCLLVSYKPLALQCKHRPYASKQQCKVISDISYSGAHRCAHVFDQCSLHTAIMQVMRRAITTIAFGARYASSLSTKRKILVLHGKGGSGASM